MSGKDKWEDRIFLDDVRRILRDVGELSDDVIDRIYDVYHPLDRKEA